MSDLSDSLQESSETFPNWNKYQIQVKELKLDLASEKDNAIRSRRRWNNLIAKKLEFTKKINNELTSKTREIAKLQSGLEKSEAERQCLEYELLKVIEEQKLATEQSDEFNTKLEAENTKLKDDIQLLASKFGTLQIDFNSCEQDARLSSFSYESVIKEKEEELSQLFIQKKTLESEHEQEKISFENKQASLTEMVRKSEEEKAILQENLNKSLEQLKILQEKELQLKNDLETAIGRIKTMEVDMETVMETHRETKLNTKVVQTHMQDLDKILQMERYATKEAQKSFENLNKKLSNVQATYEDEKITSSKYKAETSKLRDELTQIQTHMTTEMSSKNSVIQSMSKQTDKHMETFQKLKSELTKTQKRQIFLEEKYFGCMQSLRMLSQIFRLEEKSKLTNDRPEKPDTVKPLVCAATTTSMTDQLYQVLRSFEHRLNVATEENIKHKSLANKLTNETNILKELLNTKDKMIEETQTNYTYCAKELNQLRLRYKLLEEQTVCLKFKAGSRTSNKERVNNKVERLNKEEKQTNYTHCVKELNQLRIRYKQLEEQTVRLQFEVDSATSIKESDKAIIERLNKEIVNLKANHKKENEEKLEYLHTLCQQLLTDQTLVYPKEGTISDFTWFGLTLLVNERVSSVLNNLQKANQKVSHLEDTVRQKESCVTGLKKSYEEQLSHMMALSKERELSWQKQKTEIKSQYENELRIISNEIKDKQAIAEKAIDKMKCSSNIHRELESKCKKVQELLCMNTTNNAQLQIVCCLLCSLVWPLYTQILDLIMQCHILKESVKRSETTFSHLRLLIQNFNCQLLKFEENSTNKFHIKLDCKKSPIMRFRCCAIVILAANRLIFLRRTSKRLLSAFNIALEPVSLIVQAIIGGQNFTKSFSGCLADNFDEDKSKSLLQLLTNQNLNESLRLSVIELQQVVSKATLNDVSQIGFKSFLVCTRGALNQIANILVQNFQNKNYWNTPNTIINRESLSSRLTHGLQAQLRRRRLTDTNSLLYQKDMIQSLQNCTSDLNRHILEMTSQLHQLKQKQDKSAQEKSQFELDKSTIFQLQEQLKQLHEKQQKQIPIEKFEKLVTELKSSMLREQRTDQLLKEQSSRLMEMASQIDGQNKKVIQKEKILSEITESLSQCQETLKIKEQSLHELKKQIKQHNDEKEDLQENLLDAEKTLKTAAQDKMVLRKYLKSVHKQFNQVKEQISFSQTCDPCSSLPLLLKAEHIPSVIGKTAPELIACQDLVKSFVESLLHAFRKVGILEEEVISIRKHITTLKAEFSNVIHQDREELVDMTYFPMEDDNSFKYHLKPKPTDISLTPEIPEAATQERYKSTHKSIMKKSRP